MFALAGQQFELLDRVAVDHEDVGERPRRHDAELARHPDDFSSHERRLPDDFDRRQDLAAQHELAALVHLQLAEKITAVADRHAGTLADFQGLEAAVDHEIVLREHVGRHAEFLCALPHRVIGDQIRHEKGAVLFHQLGGWLVDEIAVLDGAHALADCARDRLGCIGVGLRVAAERGGFLDRRADFLQRELTAVQRIVGTRHAARDHDLDLVRALP